VVAALDAAAIPYMISGSLASSLQGEPRASHDIDLVVEISPADVPRLAARLAGEPPLYLDQIGARDAVAHGTLFNLIDEHTGDKVDFWPLTSEPFDRSRFARRRWVDALGLRLPFSAPEDTILMKLRWAHDAGGSERQLTDALRVYELQAAVLDHAYLDEWAAVLGVTDALARLRDQAEPLDL
jgi:hypothetical protein